jgi:uncharacterized protein (TIGR00266 family)
MADEIDYRLIGDDLQAVIITLDPNEMVIAEAGAMMYMEDGIVMQTTLDPNASGSGLLGKLMMGAKRALAGDSFFVTTFGNMASRRQDVAFASPYPGKITPIDLRKWGGRIVAQKDAFLCAARGANVTIAFTRRLGAGFFGGEGFILQRIEGDGLAFLHASGTMQEMQLRGGESLRVDTGCLVAMEETVDFDIETVPGIKTALFGGEGLFLARLRGPGRVLLQTMPFSRLADRILAASAHMRGGDRHGIAGGVAGLGAASILGGLMRDDG